MLRRMDVESKALISTERFVHLHVHDQFSLLDGYGSAEQYADRAKEMGFRRIALTNHGNVDGVIKFQQACLERGIKPIIGCEGYIVPDLLIKQKGEKRFHITLLVKNETGFRNLLKLLTVANLQGFYYRPRFDPKTLLDHCEGLVVMSACASTFLLMDGAEELVDSLSERTDVAIEIMPLELEIQDKVNEFAINFARDRKLPIVATNDCHYPLKEDAILQEILLAMQSKTTWADPKRWTFGINSLYLKSPKEMLESFAKIGNVDPEIAKEAIANTEKIASLCDFEIKQKLPQLPKVFVPDYPSLDEDDQLIALIMDGLDKIAEDHEYIRNDYDKYVERIEEELAHIMPKFTRYFLIVWELIDWCKKQGIMTGGRGSSAGSLCCYCLGITRLDPIKHNLIFSRFISPGRIDLPDIDMDFEDRRRDDVKQHLADTYGKWNVIEVSTFLKMHGRGALRDVSRVFDVPLYDADKAAKAIVVRSGGDFRSDFSAEDAFNTFEDAIKFKQKYPMVAEYVTRIEGTIKAAGRHAAATCVSEHDLRSGENANFVVRNGANVCNWEKNDAEFMGLMKLDVLGLNSLTILSETRRLVKERHGADIRYDLIDLEDDKIYDEFTKGNTVGVFQFNSSSMMKLCQDIHGENFHQVVALNALHRPGALRSGFTQVYRDRKFGKTKTTYVHPWIENITKDTQGLIIYQEQAMALMYELGGLPWKTADTIRKVISKSKGVEEFMKFEQDFIDGCERLGTLSRTDAKTIFGELKNMGSYSFNKSHAAEYSLTAVWTMYLKVYYPLEFMATLLSYGPSSKKHELINEAKRLGIKILLPDINLSDSKIWKIQGKNNILAPFLEVKGIGEVASDEIVACRGLQGYASPEDLESRVPKRKVNVRVRRLLEEVMAYEEPEKKESLSEEELERLSGYFDFELSNDPLYKFRNIIRLLGSKIEILPLSRSTGLGKEYAYYFGRMETLRVGYRSAVEEGKKKDFGSLGGVYGNIKDDTDFKRLVFGNKIYMEKKSTVEHCEGQAVLTYAHGGADTSLLQTQATWFADELISGDLEGIDPELAQDTGVGGIQFELGGLKACSECELSGECSAVVCPTSGSINIMIVGEAPGRDEDREGTGFIGASGKLLWRMLKERGFDRDLAHITNVCKCYPRKTRTPKKKHVNSCSKWLDSEIEIVKPFLTLSFGNTGNLYFRGEGTGIMSINGETIWNDKAKSWVTYSVHPAMCIRNAENMPLLEKALDEFVYKLSILM